MTKVSKAPVFLCLALNYQQVTEEGGGGGASLTFQSGGVIAIEHGVRTLLMFARHMNFTLVSCRDMRRNVCRLKYTAFGKLTTNFTPTVLPSVA